MNTIFTIIGIIISNETIKLVVYVIGFVITNILIKMKIDINISLPQGNPLLLTRENSLKSSSFLLKWIVISGSGYFILPYIWTWGINTDLFPPLLIILTIISLVLPIVILRKLNDNPREQLYLSAALEESLFYGFIAWLIGAGVPFVIGFSREFWPFVGIPLLVIFSVTIVYAPSKAVWYIGNIIAGAVYTSLGSLLIANSLAAILIASLSSGLITGLACIIAIENQYK